MVALAVIVGTPAGASNCAPIARRVFDYLLLGRCPSRRDMRLTRQGPSSGPIGPFRQASEVDWPPALPR